MMKESDQPSDAAGAGARLVRWFDSRMPSVGRAWRAHMTGYYVPRNLNFWYLFGALALLVLVIQIVTGIFLLMHYKPDAHLAFASVESIMRDVPWGWLIRYMHSTGASAIFVVVYLHMFRGLLYGSYRRPRELVWLFGCVIYLLLMAEAFTGYLLPWGQVSYWAAQVITNLFSAIPGIGPDLALWIRGDYVVSDATLTRFFALHVVVIPLLLVTLVVVHLISLHDVGSNNPDGVELKGPGCPVDAQGHPLDGVPFHPYYTVHDLFAATVFLLVFFAVVFFAPEMGGYFLEYNNFIPANPLVTPQHIAPVWYFTPFYAMLRATTPPLMLAVAVLVALAVLLMWLGRRGRLPLRLGLTAAALALVWALGAFSFTGLAWLGGLNARFWGVVVMALAVLLLFFLPWLDRSPVYSIRYRPGWHKIFYGIFAAAFLLLGVIGTQPPSVAGERVAQGLTLLYFGFFLLMPWWSRRGRFKAVPARPGQGRRAKRSGGGRD